MHVMGAGGNPLKLTWIREKRTKRELLTPMNIPLSNLGPVHGSQISDKEPAKLVVS